MEKIIDTFLASETDTVNWGQRLSSIAKKGDVFALYGTLGMGKSVLARAFVQKLCGLQDVPSPTFTLLQNYEAPDFEVFHFDLYRIKSAEEIFEIGVEEAIYSGVSLIEWPEKMGGYLPRDVFKVELFPQDGGRRLQISAVSGDKKQRLQQLLED